MPSGLSSPSRRTRTPTVTANSTWRGRGTASLLASNCATPSGTRSTWATRSTVSSIYIRFWTFLWGGRYNLPLGLPISVYLTLQVNSTTSAISLASAKITVSLLIHSWTAEQAGSSEPTSNHPDSVHTLFDALLAGVWKCFHSCGCSGSGGKSGLTCRDSEAVSVTSRCHILGWMKSMFWHLCLFGSSDTKHVDCFHVRQTEKWSLCWKLKKSVLVLSN